MLEVFPGTNVLLEFTLKDSAGTLQDPTGATVTTTDPNGTTVSYTIAGLTLTHVSLGVYSVIVTPSVVGQWLATAQTTGTYATANLIRFRVNALA